MRSTILQDILKETPLEIRIKVCLEAMLITSLVDMGFRESRMWNDSDEDNELLQKIHKSAKQTTEWLLEDIKQWEDDGRP